MESHAEHKIERKKKQKEKHVEIFKWKTIGLHFHETVKAFIALKGKNIIIQHR